jgi:hypothetical protein
MNRMADFVVAKERFFVQFVDCESHMSIQDNHTPLSKEDF